MRRQRPNAHPVFGVLIELALGWAARKPSRKHWNTAEECVPRWAKQDGFRLMTKEEANQHGLGLR